MTNLNLNLKRLPKTVSFTKNGEGLGNPLEVTGLTSPSPMRSQLKYNNNSIVDLSIYDVEPYDNNPRRFRNKDKWAELKESIRAVGVKYHVKVVKHPSSKTYMIAAGGNSRLLILRELFEETQDPRFATIPVQEVDFISEDDLLVQHILENEQRAEVAFWDKACAYDKLIQRLGFIGATNRELSERLTGLGLSISQGKIGEFIFATKHLNGLGAFCSKLSSYKTIDLRKLFYDLQKNENLPQPPSESTFADFWNNELAVFATTQQSADDINIKVLVQQINEAYKVQWPIQAQDAPLSAARSVVADKGNEGLGQPSGFHDSSEHETEDSYPEVDVFTLQLPFSGSASDSNDEVNAPINLNTTNTDIDVNPHIAAQTPRQILIESAKAILSYGNLTDALRLNDEFPYGFYVEVPNLNLNIEDDGLPNIVYFIDQRHEEARAIFWFFLTGLRRGR